MPSVSETRRGGWWIHWCQHKIHRFARTNPSRPDTNRTMKRDAKASKVTSTDRLTPCWWNVMFCLYCLVCLTQRSAVSTDEDMYHHRRKQRSFSRYPIINHHSNSNHAKYHPVLKIRGNTAHIHISYRIHAHQVSLVNIHPLYTHACGIC